MCPEMLSNPRSRSGGVASVDSGDESEVRLMAGEEDVKPSGKRSRVSGVMPVLGLGLVLLLAWRMFGSRPDPSALRVATWNIAAINNNPFEYWITHDDADYNRLGLGLGVGLGGEGEGWSTGPLTTTTITTTG